MVIKVTTDIKVSSSTYLNSVYQEDKQGLLFYVADMAAADHGPEKLKLTIL